MIGVPLLRDGDILGILVLHRTRAVPFTEKQIELVETFADQAVIAIENTRLFEAEQASKRELQESLEYQTAIGHVLDVISRSPTRLQQVLDTIAKSAARLCDAEAASIFRRDDGRLLFAAHHGALQHGVIGEFSPMPRPR
jgi:two-component system NtrC family sensor kinase